ncbi:uncharacterized protein LOC117322752 [Pecten maximus]|uniref:uncharacterized protein LOC117322752 n=1 Tax=Pecten maximus TaxID=6579 RepID=UPI0014582B04|nr:uncharacterized protein LOC117322752 [Pecten maximus]
MADTEDLCIVCRFPVTRRQQAVACDSCERWQHRTCDTGISLADYRLAVRTSSDICFTCLQCAPDIPPSDSETDITDFTDQLPVANFNLDDSFDMSDRERPDEATEPQEESFDAHGEPAEDSILDDQPTTYEVLAKGTTRGKPLLVSSDGYTYTVKRTNKSTTIWTCSLRSKVIHCYVRTLPCRAWSPS